MYLSNVVNLSISTAFSPLSVLAVLKCIEYLKITKVWF